MSDIVLKVLLLLTISKQYVPFKLNILLVTKLPKILNQDQNRDKNITKLEN